MLHAILGLTLLACPPPGAEIKTEHYDLYVESIDAKDVGAMLEALYANHSKFFGGAPRERLRLEVYATFEAFQEATKRDKVGTVEAGGIYWSGTKTAYLFLQPSEYYSRHLIIHEATHQFHMLAKTGNQGAGPRWYSEGLAEYFANHNWDGKTLLTGVVPAVSLENDPAKALKQFEDLKEDLEGIARGTVACDNVLGGALVHFLVNNHEAKWKSLAARLDVGVSAASAWKKSFGKTGPEFTKSFKDWLVAHQQPLRIVWVNWQERGDAIEGKSEWACASLFRSAPASIEAEIELKKGDLKAGLIFNYKSNDDYALLQVTKGRAAILKVDKNVLNELAGADIDPAIEKPVVAYRRDGSDAVLSVNGKEIGRVKAEGEAGLWLQSCEVFFRLKK